MESNTTTCESRDMLIKPMACFPPVLASCHCGCRGRGSCREQRLAHSGLDGRALDHGRGLYCERAPLWARRLLPHRPLLPRHGPRRIVVRSRHLAPRRERLEPARTDNPDRRHRPVVPARDVCRKISHGSQRKWQPSLSHFIPCGCRKTAWTDSLESSDRDCAGAARRRRRRVPRKLPLERCNSADSHNSKVANDSEMILGTFCVKLVAPPSKVEGCGAFS